MRCVASFGVMLIAATAACTSVGTATMRLPANLAQQSAQIKVEGFSGWNHGRFKAGDWSGTYERSEQRLAFFDTYVRNSGRSEFAITGPGISATIDASCQMREHALDFGIAEFKPNPMSYRCEFEADGNSIPARFELQEIKTGIGGALNRRERRGEIALDGEIMQIRSVHRLAGSPIELASPIGYLFEEAGRPVGAVELNGAPVIYLEDTSDEGRNRTVAIGAIALAAFRDPANSALGDN